MIEYDNDDLIRIAEAIADGVPIDWDTERTRRPELDEALNRFSVVELVARAHRSGKPPETPVTEVGHGAAAHPSALPDLASWGPLTIVERLGEGSFGEVYRAYDPMLEIEVALKLWRPMRGGSADSAETFLAEARRLARVRHPNVLTVHGAAVHDGRAGMWTDLVHGVTLEQLLAERGRFGAHEAALIGMDLCRALAAIHAVGMVHRDVKAANVIREQGGRIVLMDFGSVGDLSAAGDLAATDSMHGTPLAMSPEQLSGHSVGPRADLYGLGALLYRLVSGRHPIEASNIYELVEKHRTRSAVPLRDRRPDLPADFVRVVTRALDPEPDARFGSAGSMEHALALVVGTPGLVEATPASTSAERPPMRRRHVLSIAAAAIVIAVAAITFLPRPTMFSGRSAEPAGDMAVEGPRQSDPSGGADDAVLDQDVDQDAGSAQLDATAAPRPLVSSVHLFRATAGGEERLLPGAHVVPGDGLFLEIEGSDAMNVYVMSEDEAGAVFVLFPAPGLDTGNPLAPNRVHRLPGRQGGRPVNWQVTSAGGKETVIVVASRKPLPDLERDIATFPLASVDRPVVYGEVSDQTLATLRGIGGLTGARPSGEKGTDRLSQVMASLPAGSAGTRDPWIWQIELSNPAEQ